VRAGLDPARLQVRAENCYSAFQVAITQPLPCTKHGAPITLITGVAANPIQPVGKTVKTCSIDFINV
jgi:hypothetical protein